MATVLVPRAAAIVSPGQRSPPSSPKWPILTNSALKALRESPSGTGEASTQHFLNTHPQFTDLFDALEMRQYWEWDYDPDEEFSEIYNKLERVLYLPPKSEGQPVVGGTPELSAFGVAPASPRHGLRAISCKETPLID